MILYGRDYKNAMSDDVSDHSTRKQGELSRPQRLIQTLVASTALMAVYGFARQAFLPHLQTWAFPVIDAVVCGSIAALAGYLLLREQDLTLRYYQGAEKRQTVIANRTLAQLHQISQHAPGMVFQFRFVLVGFLCFLFVCVGC